MMAKKYDMYKNTDGSYSVYESDGSSSVGTIEAITILVKIFIFIIAIIHAPISYFVTRWMLHNGKYSSDKSEKRLRLINKVTKVLTIAWLSMFIVGSIIFVAALSMGLLELPF